MTAPAPPSRRPLFARFGRWFAELVLVFVGAYAAFWLNNYQEHRQEAQRRDQILAALEHQVTAELESAKTERDRETKVVTEFGRALAAGEMPPLKPLSFSSDYSATDVAALLQSGGYQLLDIKTLVAIRRLESTIRGGLSVIAHGQKLSDELLVPNLDQDISFFYDPASKQLRKRFALYPQVLQAFLTFFDDYIKAETELLLQIKAERQRH